MLMDLRLELPAIVLTALSCGGCVEVGLPGSSGDQVQPGSTAPRADSGDVEEGSCDAWKVAYCDAIDQCDAFSNQQECEIDVGYVRCKEDAPLSRCQLEIEEALSRDECGELPAGCTPTDIADRTVPTQSCERLHEEMCEWSLFCGYELSVESCMATKSTSEPCDQYTAVWPGITDCLDGWATLACDESAPEICRGLFRR